MNDQLPAFLKRIGSSFTENWYKIRDIQDWMLEEIYRKHKSFPRWRKKVLFSYVSWNKHHKKKEKKNDNTIILFTEYLYKKLDWLFRYYFKKMVNAFDEKHLELIGIEGNIRSKFSDIFFEYIYHFDSDEIKEFKNFEDNFGHQEHLHYIISYVMNVVVMVFGKLMKDIIKKDLQISMIGAKIIDSNENQHGKKNKKNKKKLHFLIVARNFDKKFLKRYLFSLMYHFAEILPDIDKKLLKQLEIENEKIYALAYKSYPFGEIIIREVLFTLQKKIQIVEQITPSLDILNFIVARVEDSIFNSDDLIRDIIKNKILSNKNPNLEEPIFEIFDFLNKSASLFSTFQSNNKAKIQNQYQLFFFYCQHFFLGDVELMVNKSSFLFKNKLNERIKKSEIFNTHQDISQTLLYFLGQGMAFESNNALNTIFKKIFGYSVNKLNEQFFQTYLFSLNKKFHQLIENIKTKNNEFNYDFNEIIHFITILLYNLAKKIFIETTPDKARNNFIDKIGRYTEKNITLRVLELKIFKDIPLSDRNWQDYYLSRNKNYVQKIFQKYYKIPIPDNYFFSDERLLKINMMYEREILQTTDYFENWFFSTIIERFFSFKINIDKQLSNNPTRNELSDEIFKYFSSGIIETELRDKLQDFAELFSNFWLI